MPLLQEQKITEKSAPTPVNWMQAMMEAIQKNQDSEQNMQITDSKSTKLSAAIEAAMNEFWYHSQASWYEYVNGKKVLTGTAAWWAEQVKNAKGSWLQKAQAEYGLANSKAQMNTSMQNSVMEENSQQVQTDASNAASIAQMGSFVNSFDQALSQAISQIIA